MPELRRGAWTSAQRKNLSAIRYAHVSDPKDYHLDRAGAWKLLIEMKGASGDPPAVLDPQTELGRLSKMGQIHGGRGITDFQEDLHRPVVAFWMTTDPRFLFNLVFPDPENPTQGPIGHMYPMMFWAAVRRCVFDLDEATFVDLRRWIAPIYKRLVEANKYDELKMATWLAYAFSRDPSWAHELARAALPAKRSNPECEALLASMTDADLALKLAEKQSFRGFPKLWAPDVVEGLGRGAIPVLEKLLSGARRSDEKKPLDAALKIALKIEDEQVVAGPLAPAPKAAPAVALPACLTDPFAAPAEKPAPKKKAPKVEGPVEVATIRVSPERMAAWQEEYASRSNTTMNNTPVGDDTVIRKEIDDRLQPTFSRDMPGIWYALRDTWLLSHEGRAVWARELSDETLALVMRDRNGMTEKQFVDQFVIPLGRSEPTPLIRMALQAPIERFVFMAEYFSSPSIVLRLAEIAAGKKSAPVAAKWLTDHPGEAIAALVPAATNAVGKARIPLVAALDHLRAAGHGAAIDQLSTSLGADLSVGPLVLAAPRTLPPFFQPAKLPQLMLRSGEPLSPEIVKHVGEMLAVSPQDAPMPGLQALVEWTTAESRHAFASALVEAWLKLGAQPQDRWPLDWSGFIAGDAIADQLRAWAGQWAQAGQHQRAFWAVDALARMGTVKAGQAIVAIADESPFQGLDTRAETALGVLARQRGLSLDELLDELVPDLGIRYGEALQLNYGARSFQGVIKPGLRLVILDGDTVREDLPSPRKSDDAVLAREAQSRVTAVRAILRKLLRRESERLERAMIDERRWTPARFRTILDHPAMVCLAQGLVWGLFDASGTLLQAFRIDETRAMANVADEAVEISADGLVGIVHPVWLGADLDRWRQIISDYEILQPFPQVGRPVADARGLGQEIEAIRGVVVKTGSLHGLRKRGWRRGDAEDAGLVHSMVRHFHRPDGQVVSAGLGFEPGFGIGGTEVFEEQTLQGVSVEAEKLGAVAISELALDLGVLRGG